MDRGLIKGQETEIWNKWVIFGLADAECSGLSYLQFILMVVIKCNVPRFTDDIKLGGTVSCEEDVIGQRQASKCARR